MTALKKRWVGTTSDPSLFTNWAPISLRNPLYTWTLSGSGATEFYLRTAANANPGISIPPAGGVYLNGASVSSQSLGSLTAGHYGYGDNDTLGYSTIYVRTSGGVDPDTLALDYVQLLQVPVATDHVRLPVGCGAFGGYDFTGVAIGDFIVEDGCAAAIGSATVPLSIDPDLFDFAGTGLSYINSIGAIAHDVRNAKVGSGGAMGLYLTLSAAAVLTVLKGTVGLAVRHGEISTAATVRVTGPNAKVYLGKGVTNTTSYAAKGSLFQSCAGTTANIVGNASFVTEEAGAIGTVNMDGTASAELNSTGAITALNMPASYSGTVDMLQSSEARAIGTVTQKGGTLLFDDTIVTITTDNVKRGVPQKRTVTAV